MFYSKCKENKAKLVPLNINFTKKNILLFQSANTQISPDLSTALVGIVQVFATFLSVIIVDRLGRRILLLTSQFVVIICTFSLGYYFYMKESNSVDHLTWLPVSSLCLFIIAFSIGLGPVPWVSVRLFLINHVQLKENFNIFVVFGILDLT